MEKKYKCMKNTNFDSVQKEHEILRITDTNHSCAGAHAASDGNVRATALIITEIIQKQVFSFA